MLLLYGLVQNSIIYNAMLVGWRKGKKAFICAAILMSLCVTLYTTSITSSHSIELSFSKQDVLRCTSLHHHNISFQYSKTSLGVVGLILAVFEV